MKIRLPKFEDGDIRMLFYAPRFMVLIAFVLLGALLDPPPGFCRGAYVLASLLLCHVMLSWLDRKQSRMLIRRKTDARKPGAEMIAETLLYMKETERKLLLHQLSTGCPVYHKAVMNALERLRSCAERPINQNKAND